MRTEAEVLHGLTGVLGSTEEQSVGTGRGAESKLVESQSLTTGLLNASAGSSGETEGSNRQLGDGQKAVVVGDGADNDDSLALLCLTDVGNSARKGNRGAVDSRHEETTEDGLVEVGLGAAYHASHISLIKSSQRYTCRNCAANESRNRGSHTSQEAVELHQNLQVDVVALGSLAVAAPHMVAVQVDTCDLEIVNGMNLERREKKKGFE